MRPVLTRVAISVFIALVMAFSCISSPLDEVLRAIPAGFADWMVFFTDWAQIKENLGLEFLTSAGPLELRFEMGLRLSEDQAAASAFGLSWLRTHAEHWGWDSSDLLWEASITSDRWPPIYLLKFPIAFDFTGIASRFAERGFTQTPSQGIATYSHPPTPSVDWIRTTELSILNTAILAEQSLLILSSSPVALGSTISTWLGTQPSAASDALAVRTVRHLEEPETAVIVRDPALCLRFLQTQISDASLDGRTYDTSNLGDLLPYQAFAVGYHEIDDRAIGRILFEYETPENADLDLLRRCDLARSSLSRMSDRPVSETYFTVLDCQTSDGATVLTVAPVDNRPSLLLRMVYTLDAAFAACAEP